MLMQNLLTNFPETDPNLVYPTVIQSLYLKSWYLIWVKVYAINHMAILLSQSFCWKQIVYLAENKENGQISFWARLTFLLDSW